MTISINLIALNSENATGAFRYIKLLLTQMGNYQFIDTKFIIYKQRHISEDYIGIPTNIPVEYINVPSLTSKLQRVIFEQTLFYFYLKKTDVFYSFCTSLPLFVRAKRIFTLHDVYYLTLKGRYGFLQTLYLKTITKLYVKRCCRVLTVSEFSKKEIVSKLKVDPNKITITPNFIQSKNITPKITSPINYPCNIAIPFFLYIGTLQPGKNINGLIKGFNLFREKNPTYNLLLVGRPTHKGNEILNSIKNIDHVYYLGFLPREEVEFLLSKCIAVTLVSFCEGFGIPPLEGFSYGKPAIVSNISSLPEVVGKAGVLVNPYDIKDIANGFTQIIHNQGKYSNAINEQLSKFDADNITQKFMKTLEIKYKKI